jgi:hypothetical protein
MLINIVWSVHLAFGVLGTVAIWESGTCYNRVKTAHAKWH